mgnify:CR=1 FL=1
MGKSSPHFYLCLSMVDLTFAGKHVAMMALTKTVGQIVRVFDMEWAAPRDEWEVTCRQHVRQTGVIMRLKRREVLQK